MVSFKRFALIAFALAISSACSIPAENGQSPALPSTHMPATLNPQSPLSNGQPCPDSRFTCVTLSAPLDHADPNSQLITVTIAILPATGERKGFFVTATGGPGSAGISYADSYTDGLDPSIPEHFDIVFFDQRGAGLSGGLACPDAAAAYYDTDANPSTPEGETALLAAAQTFAADCVRNMGEHAEPLVLDYLGTRQAVEDLELFRQAMGDEKFWLYGESYGTQFAQMYAAAHPDRLAGLILDGTVDLTLAGPDYLREQAGAFNDVLVMTLEACNADPACAADMGQDAAAVYDSLAARLAVSPVEAGGATNNFTLSDLELTAVYNLYSPADRTTFLKALAAANRGDFAPLAEMHNVALAPDPAYSDAMYYAVECNDYQHFAGAPDEQAQAYLRAGDEIDESALRLGSVFYGDLPCAYWPVRPDSASRPGPLILPGAPTLILAAAADPATPYSNSLSVYSRLSDGYLVTMEGGPHVIFGRGDACVDDLVTAFLVEGKTPARRETVCPGLVIEPY